MRRAAAALAAVLVLAAPAAAAACPRTSVTDLEDEVMCPVCGTALNIAGDAPLAQQERKLIGQLVAQCKTKAQIKDALVAQYGENVLAEPRQKGFGLTTYLVPGLAFAAGAAAVVVAALRWRRRRPAARPPAPAAAGPDPNDSARLEADLRRYDL